MITSNEALEQYAMKGRRRKPTVRRMREILRVSVVQRLLRGEYLPSEWDLVSEFGVSRGVIREALDLLRDEGLIERLQGAGTFVVSPERTPIAIDELGAMVKGIDDGIARVRWDLLEFEVVKAPRLIAEHLRLAEGSEVVYAERRQNLDGEPVQLRSSWMPAEIGKILRLDPSATRRSMYELIETAIGHTIARAELRVEATLVDSSTSSVLGLPGGAPLLLMERLVFDVLDRPVEYGHSRLRADRGALTTVMRREGVELPAYGPADSHSLAGDPRKRMHVPYESNHWPLQRTN